MRKTSQTIQNLKECLLSLPVDHQDTLFIFDVDQVLIDPIDAILSAQGEALKTQLMQQLETELGANDANELYSIIIKQRRVALIEDTTPDVIAALRAQKIPTIALTAFPTHQFGCIPSVEEFRETQLRNCGIDFSFSFANLGRIVFHQKLKDVKELKDVQDVTELKDVKDMKESYPQFNRLPVFQNGILYTGTGGFNAPDVSKAEVLQAFLKTIAWRPKHIVFIDDGLNHLQAMQMWCIKAQIPVTLLHYVGALLTPREVCKDLALLQFTHLIKHRVWLSDLKALPLLKKGFR